MIARKSLIHAIADCKNCGKHWEDYLTAQQRAWTHARSTGHHVVIDLGYFVEYNAPAQRQNKEAGKWKTQSQ